MPLTILEGSTFCVSDERGDIIEPTMGLFAHDTRFLSRWALTINGARPLILSSRKVEYYSAAFFLRNPVVGGLEHDEISIARHRKMTDPVLAHHRARLREARIAIDRVRERRHRPGERGHLLHRPAGRSSVPRRSAVQVGG